jgi:hypothetical protein
MGNEAAMDDCAGPFLAELVRAAETAARMCPPGERGTALRSVTIAVMMVFLVPSAWVGATQLATQIALQSLAYAAGRTRDGLNLVLLEEADGPATHAAS